MLMRFANRIKYIEKHGLLDEVIIGFDHSWLYRVTQKKRNPILIILNTRVPFFLGHPCINQILVCHLIEA